VYFLFFRNVEQLALALKKRVSLEFFTVFKYFLSFRIFEQLALALKTDFALKFSSPGGGRPPASYAYGNRVPLVRTTKVTHLRSLLFRQ